MYSSAIYNCVNAHASASRELRPNPCTANEVRPLTCTGLAHAFINKNGITCYTYIIRSHTYTHALPGEAFNSSNRQLPANNQTIDAICTRSTFGSVLVSSPDLYDAMFIANIMNMLVYSSGNETSLANKRIIFLKHHRVTQSLHCWKVTNIYDVTYNIFY